MKYLIIIIMLLFSNNKMLAQLNRIACEKVQYHLNNIKNYLRDTNSDSSMSRIESIAFLEKLTGIDGSGDGTTIGKFSVTVEDYNKWNKWFKENKKLIFYNKLENKVERRSKN